MSVLDRVWREFLSTRTIIAKMVINQPNSVPERRQQARAALDRFRREVDRSQIALDYIVTAAFLDIDEYLDGHLYEDGDLPKPGVYEEKIKALLKKLEVAVNNSMGRRTHRVRLSLVRTPRGQ